MAKKDKATRLPKKVGGVKLPKQFRKSAAVVAELAQNPIAREVVSAALVAGATALAKRKIKGPAGPAGARKPGNELDTLIAQGKDVGNMFAQGVTAFFGALLKPPENAGEAETKPATAKPASAGPAAVKGQGRKPAETKPVPAPRVPRSKPGPKPRPTSR